MQKVVIIGNGIAGITAARHIRKRGDAEILVISKETPYFFSRTALMYVYMGHMRKEDIKPYEDWFWKKNRIDLLQDEVTNVNCDLKTVSLKNSDAITFDKLIIASGSVPNKFDWPGQGLNGVQGLYSMQDLDLLENNSKGTKTAVIVGGGLIGVELAEMLLTRGIKVKFLVREKRFWGSVLPENGGDLVTKHIQKHELDLLFNTELREIVDNGNGNVAGVITKTGEHISCELVGLTAGVSPNIDWLKNSAIKCDRGVVVNEFCQTNFEDIYAIGDCAQFIEPPIGRRSIEQVWYTGRIMGETVAATINGKPTAYTPGPWFNSAKFFDLEYQTYGKVSNKLLPNEAEFYWQHPAKELALHFVWDQASEKIVGVNAFGIRLRHHFFDKWLKEGASINKVLANLKPANFDPEFYRDYHHEIIEAYNRQSGESLTPDTKSWWNKIFKKV